MGNEVFFFSFDGGGELHLQTHTLTLYLGLGSLGQVWGVTYFKLNPLWYYKRNWLFDTLCN